jgi:hypothetical protein
MTLRSYNLESGPASSVLIVAIVPDGQAHRALQAMTNDAPCKQPVDL